MNAPGIRTDRKGAGVATIRDVAQRVGVAPSTVSYAFNGSRKISEETRRAVREAVDELGYHPRASVRSLRSAQTRVLPLAVPRMVGEYRASGGAFAIDISDAARARGEDDPRLPWADVDREAAVRLALRRTVDAAEVSPALAARRLLGD